MLLSFRNPVVISQPRCHFERSEKSRFLSFSRASLPAGQAGAV